MKHIWNRPIAESLIHNDSSTYWKTGYRGREEEELICIAIDCDVAARQKFLYDEQRLITW